MNIFELQLLANRVAQEFVLHNADLNQTIAKYASEKDLSRLHIQGLVSATNHAANELLRKSAEDKTFTFDLAEVDKVLSLLTSVANSGPTLAKVASVTTTFVPSNTRYEGLIKSAEQGSDAEQTRRREELRHILRKTAQRAEAEIRVQRATRTAELAKLAENIDVLTQHVKNYMLQGGYKFSEIQKHASAVLNNHQVTTTVLGEVQSKLEKLGHPFTGLLASDKELSKEHFRRNGGSVPEVPVTVVNGATPIAKTLEIINRQLVGLTDQEKLTNELSSFSSYVTTAEKMLTDNTDVNRYMLHDLDSFHRKFMIDPVVSLDKTAAVMNMLRGAKLVGGLAVTGANTARKALKSVTGKGLVRTLAVPAGLAATHAAAMKAGQSVASRARKGVAYSQGTGASDSGEQSLQ
jgi:hypothetical protein